MDLFHFPTYLIDLKASFSSGDNAYAMDKLLKVDYLLLDEIGEEILQCGLEMKFY